MTRLLLASSSPRRTELLTRAGIAHRVVEPPEDVAVPATTPSEEAVQIVAAAKAEAVAAAVAGGGAPTGGAATAVGAAIGGPGADAGAAGTDYEADADVLVLAADTIVAGPTGRLGKPGTPDCAVGMLRQLRGREHIVCTGICVLRPGDPAPLTAFSSTRVTFRNLGDGEIDAYVATGEPLDRAGAYAIQGGAAAFVAAVEGRVDTVVGLDVRLAAELLRRAGFTGALPADPADLSLAGLPARDAAAPGLAAPSAVPGVAARGRRSR